MAFSPDGARLAVGSEDRAVSVHVVSRPGKDGEVRWLPSRVRCKGHAAAILAADWSPDSATLRTSSRAHEIIHFDARTGRQAIGDFRDAEWREWTSPVGFQAMGVFQNGGLAGHEVNTLRVARARGDYSPRETISDACGCCGGRASRRTRQPRNRPKRTRTTCRACDSPPTRGERVARLHRREGQRRAPMARRGRNRDGRGDARGRRRGIASLEDDRRGGVAGCHRRRNRPGGGRGRGGGAREGGEEEEEDEESSDAGGATSSTAAALLRRRTGSSRALAYRKTRLAELDAKMSALLSAARPTPPPRRERPWARRPSVPPRGGRGAGAATPEPKPPTPEREGERLEYVDGEYRWTDAPGTNERASGREGA